MPSKPNMSSPNNQKPKISRTARISVKPVWRRKLDSCHNSSDVVPSQPTTNPQTQTNDSSHNLSSTHTLNNASSNDEHAQSQNNNPNLSINTSHVAHSTKTSPTHEEPLPHISCFHDYPSSIMSPPPRVPPPHPTTSHASPMLQVQTFTQDNYQAPPPSPSSEHLKFVEELKEAHELSALLALHLAQRNLDPPQSSSPSSPHNNNQIEKHVNNCPCCIFLQQQTIALNEHFTWIEYLLTRSQQTTSLEQHQNLQSTNTSSNPPPTSSTSPNPPTSMQPNVYLH
jgi:hypothetical protein